MTREELLQELIKTKYGSVLKFSKDTNIPYTTIRNIFSRGLDGVGVGTVVDICKHLNVDVESLMEGSLSVRPNPQKNDAWQSFVAPDPQADEFTRLFSQLPAEQQDLVLAAMRGMTKDKE